MHLMLTLLLQPFLMHQTSLPSNQSSIQFLCVQDETKQIPDYAKVNFKNVVNAALSLDISDIMLYYITGTYVQQKLGHLFWGCQRYQLRAWASPVQITHHGCSWQEVKYPNGLLKYHWYAQVFVCILRQSNLKNLLS